jgi:hypothetical protein
LIENQTCPEDIAGFFSATEAGITQANHYYASVEYRKGVSF